MAAARSKIPLWCVDERALVDEPYFALRVVMNAESSRDATDVNREAHERFWSDSHGLEFVSARGVTQVCERGDDESWAFELSLRVDDD